MSTQCTSTNPSIPNGTYQGTWGGYEVKFSANGSQHEVKTVDGIRTSAAPCVVTVKDGSMSVRVN